MNNGFYEFSRGRQETTSSVFPYTGSATISGSLEVTGSVRVSQGITGSLFGTSSWATNSITASYITSSNVYGPFGANSIVSASNALTASYVTPLNQNVILTGSLLVTQSHISTIDYIDFTVLPTSPGFNTGRIHWTDDTKTLQLDTDVNGFELEIGHQSVIRGRNTNSFTITKGTVVYINGESGNRPTFATASWEGDPSSATTIGIIAQDINSNQTGYAVTNGLIRGVNTNVFPPGTSLYLSSSGQYTDTPPFSPLHEVRLGKTITQATQGILYIDIQNGYELGELHDVLDTTTTSSYGDVLIRSGSVWINSRQLTGSYGLTGSLTATSFTGSLLGTSSYAVNALSSSFAQTASFAPNYLPLTGGTIAGSLTINNNLTVIGSASIQYISESTLNIGTNLITVNTFDPAVRFGGLAVIDSGSSPAVSASFLYDSVQDEFIFVHKGTAAGAITSSHFLVGPETYNDLGNELYLTANRIPKSVGNEHLNDSNISDNGSVVSINSNTQITGSLKVTNGITAANGVNIKWSGDPDTDDTQIFKYFDTFVITNKQNINPNTNNIIIGGGPSSIYNDVYIGKGNFYVTSGSANITGNAGITGTLNVTNGITGSLFGTSSWSDNATTASYVLNAVSSSFTTTASYVENAQTASYVLQAVSSSFATTSSFALNGGVTQIVAGTNVTISPTNGLGAVTINSTGGGGSGGTDLGLVQAMVVGLQNIF